MYFVVLMGDGGVVMDRPIQWTRSSILLSQRVPAQLGLGYLPGPVQSRGRALVSGAHLPVTDDVFFGCKCVVSKQHVLIGGALGDVTADVADPCRRHGPTVGGGDFSVQLADGRVLSELLWVEGVRGGREHVKSVNGTVIVAVGGRHELEQCELRSSGLRAVAPRCS